MSGNARILDLSPIKLSPTRTFSFQMDFRVPRHWGEKWRKYMARQRELRNRKHRRRTLRRVQYAY